MSYTKFTDAQLIRAFDEVIVDKLRALNLKLQELTSKRRPPTPELIAKRQRLLAREAVPHEIRVAILWLEAQERTQQAKTRDIPLKHIIEASVGCYVSATSVCAAAKVLGLKGRYPSFNITSRFTRPSPSALAELVPAPYEPTSAYRDYYR